MINDLLGSTVHSTLRQGKWHYVPEGSCDNVCPGPSPHLHLGASSSFDVNWNMWSQAPTCINKLTRTKLTEAVYSMWSRTMSTSILSWNSVRAATCSTTCRIAKRLAYPRVQPQALSDKCAVPCVICMAGWWHILTLLPEMFFYSRVLQILRLGTSQRS